MSSSQQQSSSQMSSQLVSQLIPQQTTAIVLMTTTTSTTKTNVTISDEFINNNNNNNNTNNNNNGVVCDILAKATETIFSAPTASQSTSALLITSENSSTARLLLPPKLEPIYPTNSQMNYSSSLSNKNDIHAILLLSEERHAPTLQPIIEMPLEQPPVLSMPPKLALNDVIVTTSSCQTFTNTTTTPFTSINTIQSTQQPIVPLLISLPPQKTNAKLTPTPTAQQQPSSAVKQQLIDANNDNNNNINDMVDQAKVDEIPILREEEVKEEISKSLPITESQTSPQEQLLSSSSLSSESQLSKRSQQAEPSEESNLNSLTKIVDKLTAIGKVEPSSAPNDSTYSSTDGVNTAEPQLSLPSESMHQNNDIHTNDSTLSTTTTITSNSIASPPQLSEMTAIKPLDNNNKIEIDTQLMPSQPQVIPSVAVADKKQQSLASVEQKPSQQQQQSPESSCKSNLVCATKSTPISVVNALVTTQQKSKQNSESLGDNLTTKVTEKVASVRKRTRDKNSTLKPEDTSAEPRASKRVRLQYQPFQSPEPLAVMPYACRLANVSSLKSSCAKEEDMADKVVIYNRGEFLAVRNEKDDFFICRTYQNVYKNSHKFKIQWFTTDNNSVHNQNKDVYMPDFFDRLDFECVLTNLTVTRLDKDQYRLSAEEKQRTINILQRAINREKGINDSLNPSQVVSDGIDVSIVGKAEEKELLEKISPKRVKQENKTAVKNKKVKTETNSGVKKKETKPIKKLIKRKTVQLSKTKPNTKLEVKRDAALNAKAKYLKKRSKHVKKGDSKATQITITTVTRGKPKVSPITITAITSRPKTSSKIAARKSVAPEKSYKPSIKMTISPVYSVSSRSSNSRAIKTNNLKVKSKSPEKPLPKRNTKPTNISQKSVSKEIKTKKVKQNNLKEKSRISERVRLHYQPFQSPDTPQQISCGTTRTIPSNTKALTPIATKSTKEEEEEGEPVIYNKGEFLAVRNEENSFFICRTFQNVYKNSHKFKMQWFSDDNTPSVFTADFYDHIDFECILTNLTLTRLDKGQYSLPFEERQRTMNILQRAINKEKGILPHNASKVTADGVDVSVVGKPEEKELLKKISLQSKVKKQKSAISKNNKELNNTVLAKKSKATADDVIKPEKVSNKAAKSSAPAVATTTLAATETPSTTTTPPQTPTATTPPRRSLRQASTCSSSSASSNFKLI